jgi:uncharacterized protein Yka (UPF0111/DUF47 family)
MFGRLMPQERRFYDLFNAHAEEIVQGSRELVAFLDNLGEAEAFTKRIDEIESAADRITHETLRLLHRTFITPLDREDIHALINAMDDILDLIQDVSESLNLYDIRQVTPDPSSSRRSACPVPSA